LFFIDLGEAGRSISQSGKKSGVCFIEVFFRGRRQGFCSASWSGFAGIFRRRYSAALKSRLVASACEPVASVAELARTHQISPSLLNRWLHAAAYPASRRKALSAETALQPSTPTAFVPVELIESPGESPIHLELIRGKTTLRMILPRSEAERCFQRLQTSLA